MDCEAGKKLLDSWKGWDSRWLCQRERALRSISNRGPERLAAWERRGPLALAAFFVSESVIFMPAIPLWPGTQLMWTRRLGRVENRRWKLVRKSMEADWEG